MLVLRTVSTATSRPLTQLPTLAEAETWKASSAQEHSPCKDPTAARAYDVRTSAPSASSALGQAGVPVDSPERCCRTGCCYEAEPPRRSFITRCHARDPSSPAPHPTLPPRLQGSHDPLRTPGNSGAVAGEGDGRQLRRAVSPSEGSTTRTIAQPHFAQPSCLLACAPVCPRSALQAY